MKKQLLALAQATDTIAKAKSTGAVTMGVRESSGALSYTLGDGKFALVKSGRG